MQVAIYTRISSDREGESLSPERQAEDCQAHCERAGWDVVEVIEDRDTSAYRDVDRPGFERLMALARSGDVQAVVVWKLDRLTRQGITGLAQVLDAFRTTGCQLVSATEAIDTTHAMGEAMAGVIASMGKQESENIGMRVARAHQGSARSGKAPGGASRLFGYTDTQRTSINEDEAALVRSMVARVLDGESYGRLAKELNEAGITTVFGNSWKAGNLSTMLRNPAYAGLRVYHGEVISEGEWEPIIPPEDHYRLKALSAQHPNANRHNVFRHPFTPVIRCECGGKMNIANRSRPNGKDTKRYRCLSGNHASGNRQNAIELHNIEPVLKHALFERICELQAQADAHRAEGEATAEARCEELEAELASISGRLQRLHRSYFVDASIEDADYEAMLTELNDRRDTIRRELDVVRQSATVAEAVDWLPRTISQLHEWWSAWAADTYATSKRDLVKTLIERVTVQSGRGSTNDRVTITFTDHSDPERVQSVILASKTLFNDFVDSLAI